MPHCQKPRSFRAAVVVCFVILFTCCPLDVKADPSEEMLWDFFLDRQDLSDEQKTRIRPILNENARARLAIMQAAGSDMRKIVGATDQKLAKVLSDRQMSEFMRIRDELRYKMHMETDILRGR